MGLGTKIKGFIRFCEEQKKEKNIQPVYITKQTSELLKGKVALITGGSGGIGYAIAEAFISAGCNVIIAGTSDSKLDLCIQKLGKNNAKSLKIDMTDVASFESKVQEALTKFDESRIDILVNSAGVHGNQEFGEVTEDTYDNVLDVNLKGLFFITQTVSNYMKNNGIKGHILNVSSAASLKPCWTPYELSKWGVRGFTLGAADELIQYGIVVNAIAPGPVATNMLGRKEGDTLYTECIPAERFADPVEIGQMAVMLASDMCNLVIGDTLYITGGSGTIKYR